MEIKYIKEDCHVWFTCPYCGAELYAGRQNEAEIRICKCGFEYYLVVEIWDKSFRGMTGCGQNCGCVTTRK